MSIVLFRYSPCINVSFTSTRVTKNKSKTETPSLSPPELHHNHQKSHQNFDDQETETIPLIIQYIQVQ
jgi:hypothetical protein